MLKWILEPEARIDKINIHCPCFRHIKYIYGQTDRQTDTQIDIDRHIDKQANTLTDGQTDRQTGRYQNFNGQKTDRTQRQTPTCQMCVWQAVY